MDNVVQDFLDLTVEYQLVTQEGLGLVVGRCLVLFYAYAGVLLSRVPEWIQGGLNMLIGLFLRYGLVLNVAISKAMTCQPDTLRSRMLEEEVELLCTGRGAT